MPKAKPALMVELWSINKWLRWTGIRLAMEVDFEHPKESPVWEPTRIGLVWWGWKDLFPKPQVHVGNFVPFDPLAQSEDIRIPVRPSLPPHELNVVTTPVVALPPIEDPTWDPQAIHAKMDARAEESEAKLERLLVEKRKHFPRDAHKVRLQAKDAGRAGPPDHASLQQSSEHCLNPIKGENLTWCRGCTNCGTFTPDKDSW